MKRYFSLFLILNVFLCYGGFHLDAFASGAAPVTSVSGCHSIGHEEDRGKPERNEIKSDESGYEADSCCLDSLIGTALDHSAPADKLIVDTITISSLNYEVGCSKKSLDDALKEHSPPDLQIFNSTFLL